MKEKLTIQLIIACVVTISGLALLFFGFWVSPTGEIHNSVLVAFGEAISFAGALLGIDYTYKYRIWNRKPQNKDSQTTKEEDK